MNSDPTSAEYSHYSAQSIPLLSIVIPVYNGEKYIQGCLESVSRAIGDLAPRNRKRIELILCDNHSTDATLAMAQDSEFSCPFRIVQPQQHFANRTRNWDFGLRQAEGTWMMMLHVDDLLAPCGLNTALSACDNSASGSATIITAQHQTFSDDTEPGRARPLWPCPSLMSGHLFRTRILPFLCVFVPFTLMRRDAYCKIGGLDDRYELVQDWDLWIRLAAVGDVFYVPKLLGLWRQHGFSDKYARIFAREHLELMCDLQRLVPDLADSTRDAAIDSNIPRVMHWLPEVSLETLAAEVPDPSLILSRPRITPAQVDEALKEGLRRVSRELMGARSQGTLRFVTR